MGSDSGGPIRLTDLEEEHLGFILMAGDGYPLDTDVFEGECVFMPLPENPEQFDSYPYLLLAEHKRAGEHRYHLTNDGETLKFSITGTLDREVFVTVEKDGWGEWGVRILQERSEQRLGFSHRVKADSEEQDQ
jgi:hypothetical protein